MGLFAYIIWDINPAIFTSGSFQLRYYGVLFALGFLIGYYIMEYFFKKEQLPPKELGNISMAMILGGVIGARMGHVLFYQPDFFLQNPMEVFMVWHGGLASHGGAIGILIALWIYTKKAKRSYLWALDRAVVPTALAGCFIRIGNLMNSEIIGSPTELPWGFVFKRYIQDMDFIINTDIPRHPAQLYESICYLIIFISLWFIYKRMKGQIPQGFLLGVFLVSVFGMRFLIEFVKENQVAFEGGMFLNMGQLLSVPFIIAGLWFWINASKVRNIKS